jgi:glyoxylase-like metal-dependent hydrolase (beta-lactamase superfamily II)
MRISPFRLVLLSLLIAATVGCAASHHDVEPSPLGVARSSDAMLAVAGQPGPLGFEKVIAADWAVDREGLINLDHEASRAAGLEPGDEPIQIYFYVLRHPEFGTYLVDSGLESGFRDAEGSSKLSAIVRAGMKTDSLRVRTTTREWLDANREEASGVLLTHIHLDHIMGMPDLAGVPVYTGPGETGARFITHPFSRGTTDRLLGGSGPLLEWAFQEDADGRFAGVIDVFGDGSLWAIHVPGHTPGSTAFLARTEQGPKLLVGDASHTLWGWEHGVEPGSFSLDQPRSAESLAGLLALTRQLPVLEVHLGHQSMGAEGGLLAFTEAR